MLLSSGVSPLPSKACRWGWSSEIMELCHWWWERETCWDVLEQNDLERNLKKSSSCCYFLFACLFVFDIYTSESKEAYFMQILTSVKARLLSNFWAYKTSWFTQEQTMYFHWKRSEQKICAVSVGKKTTLIASYAPLVMAWAWMSSLFSTSSFLLQFPDTLSSMAILWILQSWLNNVDVKGVGGSSRRWTSATFVTVH